MVRSFISAKYKAEMGLALLKEAILDHLEDYPIGLGNAEIADNLNLRSDHDGGQRNFLTYSALGILIKDGLVEKIGEGRTARYIRGKKGS